jgi:hypothetical protein
MAAGTITVDGRALAVTLDYRDANNWTLRATDTLSILGATATPSSGGLSRSAGVLSGALLDVSVSVAVLDATFSATGSLAWDSHGALALILTGSLAIAGTSVVAQLTYRSATSWSIAVNVPTVQWSPHIALSNFRLSANQNTESANLLSFSGDFTIGSATVSIMGFYTDASNWSMNGKTAELVLRTGLTVTKADLVLDNTEGSITVNAEGLLHFGGEILLASIEYTDDDNWSITATGAFSIFGLSGAVSGGVLSESAGVLSGSFTASLSGSLFGVVFAGSATLRLAADGSVSFDASGSATIGGVELAAVIEYVDGDNWSVTAGDNWIRSVAGSVTFQGSFAFSFTIGGATFTGQGTAVSQADGSTIYSDMAGSVTFTRGGQTYSLSVIGGSYIDATHWSFTVSGALLINGFDLVVSGTMSEDGSSEWTLVLNDSRAVFTSGGSTFGLSGLSGMLRRTLLVAAWCETAPAAIA